jgi:hypothetical protein
MPGASASVQAAILLAIVFATGCTDTSLTRAQQQIAMGNYVSAHNYFAAAAAKPEKLSPRQRRLVLDGLCRTEYKIGAPTYSLARQLRSCGAAVAQSGSESGQIFSEIAEIARQERHALAGTIETALAQRDIAAADDAILRYREIPGSDAALAAGWIRRIWAIASREPGPRPSELRPTISQLSHQFRHQQNMNPRQFRRWIEQNMRVDGNLMVSNVEIGSHTVALSLGENQIANAALNLDRFARVNDGLVARCHCNGSTRVSFKDTGVPAYLVRLDTASHQSEVLILDQP